MDRANKINREESEKFWAHVEKRAKEVASWPDWKKGDLSIASPERKLPEREIRASDRIVKPAR